MTNENLIPVGSLTKSYTATAVLRLYEQGKVGLNDTIDMHVDEFLKRTNGSTILDVWDGDETIKNVTIYELLHMTSGINEYNDDGMENWTYAHPDEDFSPLDYIWSVNKTWRAPPGTHDHYSSIGYELLGLVLA